MTFYQIGIIELFRNHYEMGQLFNWHSLLHKVFGSQNVEKRSGWIALDVQKGNQSFHTNPGIKLFW